VFILTVRCVKWLGRQSYLDDLQSLDPELYQGLVFLKHYDSQVEKVEDLSLNFTVTVRTLHFLVLKVVLIRSK
jgi:HECT-domain (ubiquitin-transferase)